MVQADLLCVTAVLPQASTATSPRGIKRSRSPDQQEESWAGGDDDGMCDFTETPLTEGEKKKKILGKENNIHSPFIHVFCLVA
jgi:hypothetical protein